MVLRLVKIIKSRGATRPNHFLEIQKKNHQLEKNIKSKSNNNFNFSIVSVEQLFHKQNKYISHLKIKQADLLNF